MRSIFYDDESQHLESSRWMQACLLGVPIGRIGHRIATRTAARLVANPERHSVTIAVAGTTREQGTIATKKLMSERETM